MGGGIEPLSGSIRVGAEYHKHGDPFTWAAGLRYLSPTEVEIVAALRAPKPSEWRMLWDTLHAAGITRVNFNRQRDGKKERHEIETQ